MIKNGYTMANDGRIVASNGRCNALWWSDDVMASIRVNVSNRQYNG